jgi:hypothetical protein
MKRTVAIRLLIANAAKLAFAGIFIAAGSAAPAQSSRASKPMLHGSGR